jgi:hypothetical protein
VTGGVNLAKTTRPILEGNRLYMTGSLTLGAACTAARVSGGIIDSTGNYALMMDNSADHHISDIELSTASSSDNYAVMRAYNTGATGITTSNVRLRKGTGGSYVDAVSGAPAIAQVDNWYDGVRQNNSVPLGVQFFMGSTSPSGTTSTCTVTLPSVGSWTPAIIEVIASTGGTGGGATGGAKRTVCVLHYPGVGADIGVNNSDFTSANLTIAAAAGTNSVVFTTTHATSGRPVNWLVSVSHPNGVVTVAFA